MISITDAQVNETSLSLYSWKRKKTEMQKGYVVLKSGKKLEGTISLKGSSNNVTGLKFKGDGKEIDFPITALKAYGLSGVNNVPLTEENTLVNDNKDEIFQWRDGGTVMGKKIDLTKPRNGYVITQSNERIEGELRLKKTDGVLSEIKIKSKDGKKKFKPAEIANYGLSMTISELTKNGDKTYKDEARNFHPGTVQLTDGTSETGLLAFVKRDFVNPNRPGKGYVYKGLYFTKSKDDFIKTYANNEISYVTQQVNSEDLKYSPYEGAFIAENTLDNLSFSNNFKELNDGTMTLRDGSILKGKISMQSATSANHKNSDGIIKLYQVSEIERIDVVIEGEEKAMVVIEEQLVEEYFKGTTFWAYNNPNPTNVNNFKTGLASSAINIGTSAISTAIVKSEAKKNGYTTNLDSLIVNSSPERLREIQSGFIALQGYKSVESFKEKSNNESAKNYNTAIEIAIAGKESDTKVYYKETVIVNTATNEKYILYDKNKAMKTGLESLLKGCYTFLSMSKKEQKKCYDYDSINKTIKMLDECY